LRVDGPTAPRRWIAQAFTRFEDVVYISLALLLATATLGLLIEGAVTFARALFDSDLGGLVISLLDRSLLILMLVEILYTVQVSFREHALVPEPFIVVALIAAIRRVLVLTAEFSRLVEQGDAVFRNAMIELGLLTAMVRRARGLAPHAEGAWASRGGGEGVTTSSAPRAHRGGHRWHRAC
jgi:uncharacterized membrane protein (DUF373 family)